MHSYMNDAPSSRLERSCGPSPDDWIRIAPSRTGLERIEAAFSGHAFDPHQHDMYAIGFTLHRVQSFNYRGQVQRSGAGQMFVLHPDETHDGHAGTEAGFRYRIFYVEPRLIQDALDEPRGPLPFVSDPVSDDRQLADAIMPALYDLDVPIEDLRLDEIVFNLAHALSKAEGRAPRKRLPASHWRAVSEACGYLDAGVQRAVASSELESVTGLTRYELARQFRACLGTSPYRYFIRRRLERARSLIETGTPLADAAYSSGFADQSHMSRLFKRNYGMTPGRWAAYSTRQAVPRNSPVD